MKEAETELMGGMPLTPEREEKNLPFFSSGAVASGTLLAQCWQMSQFESSDAPSGNSFKGWKNSTW